ncbi:hypothetical protein D3C72_640940 [compost metagenome]
MAKTTRLNKSAALEALTERLEFGRRLQARPLDDQMAIAEAMVERIEWHASVMHLLPRIAKGIEAVTDFNRPMPAAPMALEVPPDVEALHFRRALGQQLESLERALERVRKLGTRQLV